MRSRRRTNDVRRFADAACADAASVATNLDLLYQSQAAGLLSLDAISHVRAGVKSKCATAIISLQLIAAEMGGAE